MKEDRGWENKAGDRTDHKMEKGRRKEEGGKRKDDKGRRNKEEGND